MIKKIGSIVMVLALCAGFPVSAAAADSERPSSWAVAQVNEAITEGLVPMSLQSGYTQAITRAEFCALAVALYEKLMGPITTRVTFSDTRDSNVEKAAAVYIVHGVGDNRFAPDDTLTREQAATMLVRLGNGIGFPFPEPTYTAADRNEFSSWAADYIGRVQAAGIMSGVSADANVFSPKGVYTREQSILTVLRLYNALKTHHMIVHGISFHGQGITNERLAEMVENGEIPANVIHLDLSSNPISDISPLSSLVDLTTLNLWDIEISDISPLSRLINLTSLDLFSIHLNDISTLGGFTKLTRLSIIDSNGRMDFSPLAALVNLEILTVQGASNLRNLSVLGNLTNLTQLYIGGGDFKCVEPLSNLKSLTALGIWGAHNLDISPLSELTALTSLNLSHNQISDISPLRNLRNLMYLGLYGNQIRDISPLNALTALTNLDLGSNQIRDVSPLNGLTDLISLYLSHNQIGDISRLNNLIKLSRLHLYVNQIRDITPLGALTSLTYLDLGFNQISDISSLHNLTNL
jgi:internalin A